MTNILISNKNNYQDMLYKTWFDINQGPGNYQFVDASSAEIDIVVINDLTNYVRYVSQPKIYLDVFHNYDHQIRNIFYNYYDTTISTEFLDNRCYVITNAISFCPLTQTEFIIHNDFLWNRTKAYYSNFSFVGTPWYHCGSYEIPATNIRADKNKIFVSALKTHDGQQERPLYYRRKLFHFLQKYRHCGYIGNPDKMRPLPSHCQYPHHNLEQLKKLIDINPPPTGYSPVHNAYYTDTFLSVYSETIETGHTLAPTEKTYDALIKGHFILPFSASGFIRYLETFGFAMPDFIDYSYDAVQDDNERFDTYIREIDRLMKISIAKWRQHWKDNFYQVIRHNQQLFFDRPYDKVNFAKILDDYQSKSTKRIT